MFKSKLITVIFVVVVALLFIGTFLSFRLKEPTVPAALPEGWVTFVDSARDVSFAYPEKLSTTYISTQDWPPQIQITDGPFSCTEAGLATGRAGETVRKKIGGREYCVTTVADGAAGSTYLQYAYAFPLGKKVPILTFTLREVQCLNYNEPKQSECLTERESFNIDTLIDRISDSVVISR